METWGFLPRLQHPFPNSYFKPHIFSICLTCFKIYFHLSSHQSPNFRRINKIFLLFISCNFKSHPQYQQSCMTFVLVFAEPPDTRFNFNSPQVVIYTSFPVHRSKVILPFLCFYSGLEPGDKMTCLIPFRTGSTWRTLFNHSVPMVYYMYYPLLTLRKSAFCSLGLCLCDCYYSQNKFPFPIHS